MMRHCQCWLTWEGRKWNCMSGCGTPGPLLMKPPVSRWEELAAPVLARNHWSPTWSAMYVFIDLDLDIMIISQVIPTHKSVCVRCLTWIILSPPCSLSNETGCLHLCTM